MDNSILADSIHENAQLKKKVAKLEEKVILHEVKEKEQKNKIKLLESQLKVAKNEIANLKGYKLRSGSGFSAIYRLSNFPFTRDFNMGAVESSL